MSKIELKIRKVHPDAVIPSYAKPGDAGMDLVAVHEFWNEDNTMVTYRIVSRDS
jgi:dUTPase